LSHFDAMSAPAGRKGGLTPPIREERVIQEHKKTTTEASMLLKTQEGHRKTKLKRTQNGPTLSPQCAYLTPKASLRAPRACGRQEGRCGNALRTEIEPRGETGRIVSKYKNSGNEAKKYLETKT
jgi:hypothetical protein